jgi:phosphonate degradation associated HDIG domain protein
VIWRDIATADELADALIGLYEARGHQHYDEAVTQTAHAEQAAHLAREAGASDALVIAALLHDIGHLLEPADIGAIRQRDLRHEDIGARLLANWYGADVIESVRGHVAAKRYLCAVDPGYHATLSVASVRSLELQGGVMTADEVAAFEASPGHAAPAELRRWDDLAKRVDVVVAPIASYRDQLVALAILPG